MFYPYMRGNCTEGIVRERLSMGICPTLSADTAATENYYMMELLKFRINRIGG